MLISELLLRKLRFLAFRRNAIMFNESMLCVSDEKGGRGGSGCDDFASSSSSLSSLSLSSEFVINGSMLWCIAGDRR